MNPIEVDGIALLHKIDPKLKHVYLQVEAGGEVILKSRGKLDRHLVEFVRAKRRWIEQRQKQMRSQPGMTLGEDLLLMGSRIGIDTLKGFDPQSAAPVLRRQYDRYYRESAAAYLTRRLEHYALKMRLEYKAVCFRKMKRRWGSCSRDGLITFNTLLMQCPAEQIDYTVVHELAHLVHFNHSASFHALVTQFLPDQRAVRNQMRSTQPVYY